MMCSLFLIGLTLVSDVPRQECEEIYGRYRTLNHFGYCDPNPNEITTQFLHWGISRASRAREGQTQSYLLEVGGGVGLLGRYMVANGVHYLFNDRSEAHCEVASGRLAGVAQTPGQYEVYPGAFMDGLSLAHRRDLRSRQIMGIGAFMVLHFLTGKQIVRMFDAFAEILPRGGRVFVTAATPFNAYLMGFQEEYARRRDGPRSDPHWRFPGEIEDAHRFLPKENYPPFFHALEPDVLFRAVRSKGGRPPRFRLVHTADIWRPNPPDQAWTGHYQDGKTELMGMIFERL